MSISKILESFYSKTYQNKNNFFFEGLKGLIFSKIVLFRLTNMTIQKKLYTPSVFQK